MQKRIASIITEFKAGGVTAFRKATDAMSGVVAKFGEKFGQVGEKAKAGLDKARSAALRTTTALVRVGAAGARIGGQATLGATRMSGALARLTLRATAVATAIAAIGKANLINLTGKAIRDTADDLAMLRQTASFLNVAPEQASFFTNLAEQAGLARDEFRDAIGAYREAQGEAVSDPNSNYAKIFRESGIKLTQAGPIDREGQDAIRSLREEMTQAGASALDIQKAVAGITDELGRTGKAARPTLDVFQDMAVSLSKLTSEDRAFFLSQVFGGSDSLKISEFLDRLAATRGDIAAQMSESQRRDLLVTRRQIRLAQQLDTARGSLAIAFRSVQRQIFVQVAPSFILILNRLTRFFRESNIEIGALVSKSLGRMYGVARDIVRVFAGFDLNRFLGGSTVEVRNTWLFAVKETLDRIVAGVPAAIRSLDAMARDVQRVYASISSAEPGQAENIAAGIETRLGLGLLNLTRTAVGFVGTVQRVATNAFAFVASEFDRLVVAPIRSAQTDSLIAFSLGADVSSAEGDLTRIALAVRYLVDYVERFGKAWKAVFVDGTDAPDGFKALQDIRDGLAPILRTLGEVGRGFLALFGPIDDFLRRVTGLGLAANLILLVPFVRLGRIVVGAGAFFIRFGAVAIRSLGRVSGSIGRIARALGQSGLLGAAGRALAFIGQIVASFAVVMYAGAKGLVDAGVDLLTQGAGAAFNSFVGGFNRAWTGAFNAIGNALITVSDSIKTLYDLVSVYLFRAFDWVRTGILKPGIDLLTGGFGFIADAIDRVIATFSNVTTSIGNFLSSVTPSMEGFKTLIGSVVGAITGAGGLLAVIGLVGVIAKSAFGLAGKAATGLIGTLTGAAASSAAGTAAGAAAGAAGGAAARSGVIAGAASLAGRAGSVGAVAAGGLLTGAAIGEAINKWILEPYLQAISDVDIQQMIDRDIVPTLEATPSLGRSQSMMDVYQAQTASLDVGAMTAGSIDLTAATVVTSPNNLRPLTVNVDGRTVVENAYADPSTRIRRSGATDLGGGL